jgi:uncharacterized heparinase superfamily protein
MFKKIFLIFNTVRYLKGRQVFYQLYYRIKPKKTLDKYTPGDVKCTYLNFVHKYAVDGLVSEGGAFNFLNLQKSFGNNIDWDFQGFGKLWNYNLQYFNYLHQEDLPDDTKATYLADINTWLKDGRLKLEPYPVSLRVMNIIRYLSGKKGNSTSVINDTYAQLNYLNSHIEYHLMGNHVLENAFALFMGGCFFNNDDWQQKAKKILYQELNEQVLNDGGHFELSPMYHQIILFRILELIDYYKNTDGTDKEFLAFAGQKAINMLGWLNHISFKNGDIPHFNDSTDGIAYSTKQLMQFADQLGLMNNNPGTHSGSGYRKFSNSKYECVADVGKVGPSYQPGHSHADALSFVLYANNLPLIVDTGTSTYQIGEVRSLERSTSAHNTVVIEGKNQSEVWGGFRVGRRAETTIIIDTTTSLTASHNGYKRDFGAIHQRSFVFKDESILIEDKIEGNDTASAKLYLHFHPDRLVTINSDNLIIIDNIAVINFDTPVNLQLNKYQYAVGFNLYKEAFSVVAEFTKNSSLVIKFL